MTTETLSTPGSGLVFNNTYDDASCIPQYITCIVAAEKQLETLFTNPVTINITFNEAALGQNYGATNSYCTVPITYDQLRNKLPASDGLPSSDPTGAPAWSLPVAYARMLGLTTCAPPVDDTVTLNSSLGWTFGQDVIDTVEHEISEGAMGRVGGLGDQNGVWSTMDLFRYSAPGVRDFQDGKDGKTTYFSAKGSVLSSLSFHNEYNGNVKLDANDTADFAQHDVFGWGPPGETNTLSPTDIAVMNALGWKPETQTHVRPTVTGQNFSVSPNQAVSLANELTQSISNPSHDSLTAYGVEDLGGGSGYLTVGGIRIHDGQFVRATSNWSNVQYVGGSSAGTDQLEVVLYDATTGSFVYSSSFGATTTGVSGASTAQNFTAWTEPTKTVFDHSAGSGQYIADLAASMMKEGCPPASGASAASLSDQIHPPHSDLLYHADDLGGRERMLNYSMPGGLTAQDTSALRWQNVATPLLGSADGHAEMLGPDPHTAVFVASSRTY
jgi:hypothetical protein